MAIASITSTRSSTEIVFAGDPDVTASEGDLVGWIPRSSATVRAGADIVAVRGLSKDERGQALDAGKTWARTFKFAELGVTAVNGIDKARKIERWIEACPSSVLFCLGLYVQALTNGVDPQNSQRTALVAKTDDEDDQEDAEGDG